MRLSVAREGYYAHSASASSSARQIAFGGIAIVWLFNSPSDLQAIRLPSELLLPVAFLATALALDLLQYTSSALLWGQFARRIERRMSHRLSEDPEMDASPYLNWPGLACFWVKIASVCIAYWFLGAFLIRSIAAERS